MGNIVDILGAAFEPPTEPRNDTPAAQLLDAMQRAGLTPPREIVLDGKMHRFNSGTKGSLGAGDKSGWYVAYSDGIPAGRFGCWRAGMDSTWRADVSRSLTPAEEMAHARRMNEAKAARDAETARTRETAANTVEAIWVGCKDADPAHPYLARKGIGINGSRVTGDGRLVVPLYAPDGHLASLQYIDVDGGKLYHSGGQTGGCYWMVGTLDVPGTVYIAEGFATAATIHEVTGRPCVVAYSASNLVPVTGSIRELVGISGGIVIVADNDASDTGQKYADQAAALHRARVALPPSIGQDANDYLQAGGDLRALLQRHDPAGLALINAGDWHGLPVPVRDWIVPGWLMPRAVTLLAGAGGTGKSLLIQQWLSAISVGDEFIGLQSVEAIPALYVNCEDEADELHRRQVDIAKAFGRQLSSYDGRLHLSARVGMDNSLGIIDPDGNYSPSPLLGQIRDAALKKGAGVIALDNAMQLFVGNLNDPRVVTVFINALTRVAMETGAAVLLAGHTAKSQGSEFAGTMAWENSVRMRLLLARPSDESGKDIGGPDQRLLVRGKANSARKGERLDFTWHEGAFYRPVDIDDISLHATIDARADEAFLACLDRATEQRRNVSHNPSANFAPKVFAKMGDAAGIGQKALKEAMERLFDAGQLIANTELWSDKKSRQKWGIMRAKNVPNHRPELAPHTVPNRPEPTPQTVPHTLPIYNISGGASELPALYDVEQGDGVGEQKAKTSAGQAVRRNRKFRSQNTGGARRREGRKQKAPQSEPEGP